MNNRLRIVLDRLKRRLEIIVGSPFPIYFLAGIFAANLISDGLSSLVEQFFGVPMLQMSGIKIIAGLVILFLTLFAFNFSNLGRWLRRFSKKADVDITRLPQVKRGLIALVSMGHFVPAEPAMKYHFKAESDPEKRMKYCWLLVGPGEGELSSEANANRLKNTYEALGVEVRLVKLQDVDDPSQVFQNMLNILDEAKNEHRLELMDMIADFTGGTKCMTAGMILASLDRGLEMQFMKPEEKTEGGTVPPNAQSHPRLVTIDFYPSQRTANRQQKA